MLLLIDGSNLLHRILRTEQFNLINSAGLRTGGIHGIIKSTASLGKRLGGFGLPIVAWDEGVIKFRQEIFPEYKNWKVAVNRDDVKKISGEKETSDVLKSEQESADEQEYLATLFWTKTILHTSILPLLGVPSIMVPGAEADDIIAYLCLNSKMQCLVVSQDDDLMQLITNDVKVFKPIKNKTYDKETFIKEYDLYEPDYCRHFLFTKAIVGDGSDGIPGLASGLGEVNAKRISRIVISGEGELNVSNKKDKLYLDNVQNLTRNLKLMNLRYFQENAADEVFDIKNRVHHSLVNYHGMYAAAIDKLQQLEIIQGQEVVRDIMDCGRSNGIREKLLKILKD